MKGSSVRTRGLRGFSLLELVVAMGILSLLLGGIFQIARASMHMSRTVVEKRQFETEKAALFVMLQNLFEQLPGNAMLDLRWSDSGTHFLSTMTFQEVPMNFNWGGRILSAEAFQIVTEPRVDGYLDIVLKFYDEEVLDPASTRNLLDVDPIAEVTLLEDVNRFEWQAVNGRTQELVNEWEERGRLPLKLKLNAILQPQGEVVLHTFWITPKANPRTFIQNAAQNSRNNQRNRGGGNPQTNPGNNQPQTQPSGSPQLPGQ